MWRDLGICLALAVAVLAVYEPACRCDFVNYDDPAYVTDNPYVAHGLTRKGLVQAFTGTTGSNWHPLTMLSHMLDCQFFGVARPGWHHAVNLALHAANSVLLFLVLLEMTGARWPSAAVAALFALHPLHVESVAWIAERKDVLSTLFCMLTMLAYVRYARQPAPPRYLVVFGALALGLMCKPMLVTLPLVLLLLDYWPLRRFRGLERPAAAREPAGSALPPGQRAKAAPRRAAAAAERGPRNRPGTVPVSRRRESPPAPPQYAVLTLLLEKLPLLALSVVFSIVTFLTQRSAMSPWSGLDWLPRIGDALVGYVSYLGMTLWPRPLAVFYPLVPGRPWWQPAAAAALLAAITALVLWQVRRRPCLAVGWFWYLGTLVPVIGLVQVGLQSIADRYTYLPLVGIFIMAAWGAAELTAAWPPLAKRLLWIPLGAAVLIAAAVQTRQQLDYWKNSRQLFQHDLEVTGPSPTALGNLGVAWLAEGQHDAAIGCFRAVLKITPGDALANYHLGSTLIRTGRIDEGVRYVCKAIHFGPDLGMPHCDLGHVLEVRGKIDEAAREFGQAIRISPKEPDAYNNLAWLRATYPEAKFRNAQEAIQNAQRACELCENRDDGYLDTLAAAYAEGGRFDEAVATERKALALANKGKDKDQRTQFQQHLKLFEARRPLHERPKPPPVPKAENAK